MSSANVRRLLERVAELETAHGGNSPLPYLIHVSNPRTDSELAQIEANALAGKPFVLMPHPPASIDEWLRRFGRAA